MFFVAFDPPILKHRLTKGATRDGKFDAEDCLCLKFCSPAMAAPASVSVSLLSIY